MIGGRASLICLVITVATLATFGQRPADPALADPPRQTASVALFRAGAADAMTALASLRAGIDSALDEARRGGALIIEGTDPPGAQLLAARDALEAAQPAAVNLGRRLAALDGSARAAGIASAMPPAPTSSDEVASIAGQLANASPLADEFATMRRNALGTIEAIGDALSAFDAGDLATAGTAIARARASLTAVRGWDVNLGTRTLPIWVETTDEVVGALEALLLATQAGDQAAAAAAASRFAAVSDSAREADLALRLALDEGGAALVQTPLRRLAEVLRRIAGTEQALAPILHGGGG